MKLKNILLLSVLILHSWETLHTQTSYYIETKTFYNEGYAYQCDVLASNIAVLYNKENLYTYDHYANKDGSKVSDDVLLGWVDIIERDKWTRRKYDL